MKVNRFFELLFQSFNCGLQVGSFFDELFLLVNAVHFFLIFFLNVFAVNLNDFGFQSFVVLR